MKKTLLTITLVAFATLSFSQQLSRYVVASGGNYSTSSGISVSSTIGESMVSTLTATGFILTQGFQQASITYSGCTDPLACNYDSTATIDDGSCLTVYGCTDLTACNYDSTAVCDDGSCIFPDGCTDATACNYDSTATCDDGSCTLPVPGYDCNGNCLAANACQCASYCNSNFTNVSYEHITNVTFAGINNSSAGNAGGPVDYTSIAGATVIQGTTESMSVALFNSGAYTEYIYAWFDWNQNGSFADSGEYYLVAGPVNDVGPYSGSISIPANALLGTTRMRVMMDYNNSIPDPCRSATYGEAEDYCVTVIGAVSGCTDSTALNYNALAIVDDGSCVYPCIEGCMDSTAFNYNPLATCDSTNGSICISILYGCTDPTAINYNSSATSDDGSCLFYGCTDPTATNYNATAIVGCDVSGSTSCCTYLVVVVQSLVLI